MGERRVRNAEARGSTPLISTIFCLPADKEGPGVCSRPFFFKANLLSNAEIVLLASPIRRAFTGLFREHPSARHRCPFRSRVLGCAHL